MLRRYKGTAKRGGRRETNERHRRLKWRESTRRMHAKALFNKVVEFVSRSLALDGRSLQHNQRGRWAMGGGLLACQYLLLAPENATM